MWRALTILLSGLALSALSTHAFADKYGDGRAALQRGDYATAMGLFFPLAAKGNAKAENALGLIYHDGKGVKRNYPEALKWYRMASAKGLSAAQFNLANMFYAGEGTTRDYSEAAKWFRAAAAQGNADAQNNLGAMHATGLGVTTDYSTAAMWYRKAADQGLAAAQNSLGVLYITGQGVPQSYVEAAKWYRKAAEQGNSAAQNNLGALYYRGQGVPQDAAQAVIWFQKAAHQGNADARVALAGISASVMSTTAVNQPIASRPGPVANRVASDPEIAQAIMRQIASIPLHLDWRSIRTDKLSHDAMGYTSEFTLIYKELPGPDEVEADTKAIARAVLKQIVKMQKPSGDQSIWMSVCAIQDGLHGETGKPLVNPLGCTNYTSDNDQLSFDPNENTPPSWWH
ncbi:MAG: tetratricopeptide repeat protein [Rhizomicrobium sp.]|nr:tetratricopeptide repeat protein [Rhizomicrobium sp.]